MSRMSKVSLEDLSNDSIEFKVKGCTYMVLKERPDSVALVGYSGGSKVLVPPMSVRSPRGDRLRVIQIGARHRWSMGDEVLNTDGRVDPPLQRVMSDTVPLPEGSDLISLVENDFSRSLDLIVVPPYIERISHIDAPSVKSVIMDDYRRYRSDVRDCLIGEWRERSDPLELEPYAFSDCMGLEEVILNDRVEVIPEHTFADCDRLRSIVIPNSVREIGRGAFEGCERLCNISLPSELRSISDRLFYGCEKLSSLRIPDGVKSIGDLAFFDCRALRSLVIPDSVTSIGEEAFRKCLSLRSLTIGDGVTSIENSMFDPSPRIRDLRLGSGIRELEECCFLNWHDLRDIVLSEGLETIHDNAFESCDSLVSVTIPSSVTHIGGCVFCGADSLKDVFVRSGNTVYSSYDGCLYDSGRTELILCPPGKEGRFDIPDGVERVRMGAFEMCRGLTYIHVPDSVTDLEDAVFSGCIGLTGIRLPVALDVLGYSQLSECYALEHIDLGGVRVIGQYSLAVCTSLKEVDIPDSVEEIERNAFRGCSSLERVTIGKGVSFIAAYSFIACPSLKEVTVDPENPHFISVDGVVYTKDMRELVLYPSGKGDEEYVLPASVEEVRAGSLVCTRAIRRFLVEDGNPNYVSVDGVLYNTERTEIVHCPISDMEEYTIPAGVEHICCDAFSGSGLVSAVFPEGVTSIGCYAFYNCTSLERITLPKGLLWIDERGFYRCTSLRTMYISGLTPSIQILHRAFAHCPYDMDIVSAVDGCDLYPFDLQGTMLFPLPEGGLRHFEGILGLMWDNGNDDLYDDDGNLLDDPSKRWEYWASHPSDDSE